MSNAGNKATALTNKGGGGRSQRPVPEHTGPAVLDLVEKLLDGTFAFNLHLGLECVHWETSKQHEDDVN